MSDATNTDGLIARDYAPAYDRAASTVTLAPTGVRW
jgi:hypothetical protein